jgi:hypothetical protein
LSMGKLSAQSHLLKRLNIQSTIYFFLQPQ